MAGFGEGFKIVPHSRINDGTSSDTVLLAQSPGWLYGVQAFGLSSGVVNYLKIYDKATAPSTVATADVPIARYVVPFNVFVEGSTRAPTGAGVVTNLSAGPIGFNNGLAYVIASALADNANTTAAANTVVVNIQFATSTSK